MKSFRRYTIHALLALTLGAFGWAINRSPLFVSGGFHLQLGQIPALIAALIAGPAAGLVAAGIANLTALMASDGSMVTWVLVAEAGTVGALTIRGRSPFAADLLFWACVGTPALGAIQLASSSSLWIGAFQLAAAGYNIIFAGLIAPAVRDILGQVPHRPDVRKRLHRHLFGILAFLTLILVVSVGVFSAHSLRAEAVADNQHNATEFASRLDRFLSEQGHSPQTLAALFDGPSHRSTENRQPTPAKDSVLRTVHMFGTLAGTRDHVLLVADASGRVLYSSDPQRHPVNTILANTHLGSRNSYHWRHPATIRETGSGMYVGSTAATASGWTILIEEPMLAALRVADSIVTFTVLLSLIMLPLVLLTAYWWTSTITKPLRGMTAFIRSREPAAAAGAQDIVMVEDEAEQPEEVVEMRRALVEADERVRSTVQSLDQLVAERTADLVAARDRAESANAAKSLFLGNMSHELRSPLNVILGQAETLDEGILGIVRPAQRAALGEITAQGNHLLDLIGDLLDVSRIENGRLEVFVEDVDLRSTLGGIRDMFHGDAVSRRVHLMIEMPTHPLRVRADPLRLRQVLINLLSNAMKFTPAAGHVDVRLEWTADGATPCAILVCDTGVGIPEEAQSRVFGAFEQVSSGLSRIHNGAGLGLAISRQLCALMGMTLTLESEVGVGSRFRVGLASKEAAVEVSA